MFGKQGTNPADKKAKKPFEDKALDRALAHLRGELRKPGTGAESEKAR